MGTNRLSVQRLTDAGQRSSERFWPVQRLTLFPFFSLPTHTLLFPQAGRAAEIGVVSRGVVVGG